MTLTPLEFHLGPLTIAGFGIMMMLAFVVAGWLLGQELQRLRLRADYANDLIVGAVVGGILGAKLWYVALTGDPNALFSRAGLVFYGGFFGAVLFIIVNGRRLKVPIRWTMHIAAPALAAGYALGRIGCLLANDDYGRPTSVPWAVKFPHGAPPSTVGEMSRLFGVKFPPGTDPATVVAVHPTQVYEALIMSVVFAFLWRRRTQDKPVGSLFGWYLVLAGIERFGIEILRAKDDRFLGPFTIAQLTSTLIVLTGIAVINAWKDAPHVAPGPYLAPDAPTVARGTA